MLTAAAHLGVDARATVAIGDSENDALAGRAAGMATLTVPYGYNHGKAVQTVKSDGIVSSLLDAAQGDRRNAGAPNLHRLNSLILMFLNKKRSLSSIDRGAWPWRRWSR